MCRRYPGIQPPNTDSEAARTESNSGHVGCAGNEGRAHKVAARQTHTQPHSIRRPSHRRSSLPGLRSWRRATDSNSRSLDSLAAALMPAARAGTDGNVSTRGSSVGYLPVTRSTLGMSCHMGDSTRAGGSKETQPTLLGSVLVQNTGRQIRRYGNNRQTACAPKHHYTRAQSHLDNTVNPFLSPAMKASASSSAMGLPSAGNIAGAWTFQYDCTALDHVRRRHA